MQRHGVELAAGTIGKFLEGADLAEASRDIRLEQFASRAIIVFCVFIPLFVWREFRRTMGEEEFRKMVYGTEESKK
jgi:hypothetical protein